MRARGRIAAALTGAALLVSCTQSPAPAPPVPLIAQAEADAPVVIQAEQVKVQAAVAAKPSVSLRGRIGEISADLGDLEAELSELGAALAASEATSLPEDRSVQQAKHDFGRASARVPADALDVAKGLGDEPGTLAELVAPLQVVSDALNAGDRYQIVLLQAQGEIRRQELALADLHARVRSLRFRVSESEREFQVTLTEALRQDALVEAESEVEQATVSTTVTEIREQLHRAQLIETELRGIETRIQTISVRLEARRVRLVEEGREVQMRNQALNADMATVEQLVGERYGLWFDGIAQGDIPVIGGVLQVCPVDQPHAYSDDFGAPRYAGGYHPHQGNDIFAPEGTAIRAPFDGLAAKAENTLGGLAVKVFGDNGYVYNAHLSRYGELGRVTAGTIIGYVGNTGDAINSAPHDHFEWHPGGGYAVDPYPYLNAVCLPPV